MKPERSVEGRRDELGWGWSRRRKQGRGGACGCGLLRTVQALQAGVGAPARKGGSQSRQEAELGPSSHLGPMLTGDMAWLPVTASNLLHGGLLASQGGVSRQQGLIRYHLSPAAVRPFWLDCL